MESAFAQAINLEEEFYEEGFTQGVRDAQLESPDLSDEVVLFGRRCAVDTAKKIGRIRIIVDYLHSNSEIYDSIKDKEKLCRIQSMVKEFPFNNDDKAISFQETLTKIESLLKSLLTAFDFGRILLRSLYSPESSVDSLSF